MTTYRIESVARTGESGIDPRTLRTDMVGLNWDDAIECCIMLDSKRPGRHHRVAPEIEAELAAIRSQTMRLGFRR